MAVLDAKLGGSYAVPFWGTVACCLLVPFAILCRTRSPLAVLAASISVNIGMYLERFTIVVPTLVNPRVEITGAGYAPSWVEWSILAGSVSAFVLLYLGFTKLFPIVSVWEVEEGMKQGAEETRQRIATYYPRPEET
jgi:molybdopterin-containing oxidoreductase family membrane subunit